MANINLNPLSTATTAAIGLSNLILVTPENVSGKRPGYQPQGKTDKEPLPPKILFQYEGEQSVILESDVTDHFTEDNTVINDQVALRPETYSVTGYIGELTNAPPNRFFEYAKFAAEKITIIDAYTPALSVTALEAYNHAVFLYNIAINASNAAVASYSSMWGSNNEAVITGNDSQNTLDLFTKEGIQAQNKQQIAFQQFYGYWRQRTLFTVQTPWAIFKNMVIKTLRAVQGEDSKVITSFEITFKILRFAKTKTSKVTSPQSKGEVDATKVVGHPYYQAQQKVPIGSVIPTLSTKAATAFLGGL